MALVKRILMLAAVVALMVAMVAMSVAPALARSPIATANCFENNNKQAAKYFSGEREKFTPTNCDHDN